MSTWVERARPIVAKAVADLPDDATERQLRKRWREVGRSFHAGTYWGRKAWGRACREYLARNDKLGGSASWGTTDLGALPDDIVFPFRGDATDAATHADFYNQVGQTMVNIERDGHG